MNVKSIGEINIVIKPPSRLIQRLPNIAELIKFFQRYPFSVIRSELNDMIFFWTWHLLIGLWLVKFAYVSISKLSIIFLLLSLVVLLIYFFLVSAFLFIIFISQFYGLDFKYFFSIDFIQTGNLTATWIIMEQYEQY